MEEHAATPAAFLIEYRDGLKATALMLDGYVHDWSYAARAHGQVVATEAFLQPDGTGASFGYLGRSIQRFFQTGRAPCPAERTLLTTGVIDAAMISRHEGQLVAVSPAGT